jgi:hypothetical protein
VNKLRTFTLIGIVAMATCLAGAQTWTLVNNAPNIGASNPLVLTDGTVLVHDGDANDWWKLTPDIKGNYATGTWSKVASMPSNWGPLYFGSQVMTDGRVFAVGGEYNNGPAVWTNLAGIYDPVANKWTALSVPSAWTGMGDTATCILPNGLVYIADPLTNETAAFNPATNAFIYPYGESALMYNDEAGLNLLPNGNIFRVDCWAQSTAEVFNTTTLQWTYLPAMPYNVLDVPDAEMGPAIVQYNGLVFQFGGNGSNVQYDCIQNKWVAAPGFPGSTSASTIDVADGGAVIFPNGNILVDAGIGYFASSAEFFLWNGTSLVAATGSPDAADEPGGYGNFVLLPNGQALFTDFSPNVYVVDGGGKPNSAWAPTITSVPSQIHIGESYAIYGTQFNGLTQGSGYGDDQQAYTNFPIIRLTMNATGHVFYAKEFNPSTMAICTGSQIVSTHFTAPSNAELGAATIQVIANGIASAPVAVTLQPQLEPYAVKLYPGQGTNPIGSVASISLLDNVFYYANSQLSGGDQLCSVEADFNVGLGVTTLKPFAAGTAPYGVTEQLYVYDWKTGQFVYVSAAAFSGKGDTSVSGSPPGSGANYVGPSGEVRVIVRGLLPTRLSNNVFKMGVDVVSLQFG